MTELKPCPFCGASGLDVFMYENGETDGNYVLCERCGASIGLAFEPLTEQDAIEAWNKRATPTTKEIEEYIEKTHKENMEMVAELKRKYEVES